MKKLFFFLALAFCLNTNAQITFQKKITGCQLYYIHQTKDKGYITGGVMANMPCLIKTDSLGDTLWVKKYNTGTSCEAAQIKQTKNGGYIMVGSLNISGTNLYNIYLAQTDSLGNLLWAKTYGDSGAANYGYIVQQTFDKGFIIAGASGTSSYSMYVVKTDSVGTLQWTKTYGGNNNQNIYSFQQTTDGGYIIGGQASYAFLLKLNAVGDTVWAKTYPISGGTCQQTSDGGYIVCGCDESSSLMANTYFFKTDSNGNIVWANKITIPYGTCVLSNSVGKIQQTTDGGYMFSNQVSASCGGMGASYSYSSANTYKADSAGHLLWKTYYAGNIAQNNDTTFIMIQPLNSDTNLLTKFNKNSQTACSTSTTSVGSNTCSIASSGISFVLSSAGVSANAPTQVTNSVISYTTICSSVTAIATYNTQNSIINIYPNPAQNNFTIELSSTDKQTLQVFDINGNQVLAQTINGNTNINVANLAQGVYNISITNSNGTANKRLVIVK